MRRRIGWLLAAGLVVAPTLLVLALRGAFDTADPPTASSAAEAETSSPPGAAAGATTAEPLPSAAPAPIETLAPAAASTAQDPTSAALEAGVAQRAALPGAVASRFSGRVVEVDGTPIAGASVRYVAGLATLEALGLDLEAGPAGRDSSGDSGRAVGCAAAESPPVLTGDDGSFVVDDFHVPPAPGPRRMPGFDPDPVLVVTKAGRATYVRACLGFRGGDFDAGTLVLEPEAIVTGRLVDEQLEPVADRRLSATVWTPTSTVKRPERSLESKRPVTATSGADGRFTLRGLWPGQVSIWVLEAEGGYGKFVPARELAAGTTDLGDIGVARTRGRTLTGSVVDEFGQPVAGAEVFLLPANTPAMVLMPWGGDPWLSLRRMARGSARCDEEGRFTVDGAGGVEALRLHVRAPGHAVSSADIEPRSVGPVEVMAPSLGAWRITLVDGRTSAPLDAVLQDTVRLRAFAHIARPKLEGELPDADQPGFPWSVAPQIGTEVEVSREDEPGTWLIEDPGDSSTDLIVEADGLGTIVDKLPIMGVGHILSVPFTLEPETVFVVEVVDTERRPIPQARVLVEPLDHDLARAFHRQGQTDAQGVTRIGGLSPGKWLVQTTAEGYTSGGPRTVGVEAAGGEVRTLVMLQRAAAIRGVVLDVDGAPAPGCDVQLSRDDTAADGANGQAASPDPPAGTPFVSLVARTDPLGAFVFDAVEPGTYRVGTALADAVSTDVAAGQSSEVRLQRRQQPVVRGRVLGGGEPIEGAGLYPMPGGGGFWDVTDASGEYELRLPQAGTYEIDAYPPAGPGAAWGQFMVDAKWDETVIFDIELGGGHLRGEVVDAQSGQPLGGARVILVPGKPSNGKFATTGDGLSTHTDEAGRFLFEPVPDGWYQAVARGAAHAETRSEPFEVAGGVASGAASALRLSMEPGRCSLSVNIVNVWGEPVRDKLRVTATQGERRVEAFEGTPGSGAFFRYEPGFFVFEDLAPGRYELTVELQSSSGAIVVVIGEDAGSADSSTSAGPPLLREQVELEPGEVRSMSLRVLPEG
jgi:uncharacterized GH25 family protein